GHRATGSGAQAGAYRLRLTATVGASAHVAPTRGVNGAVLARWGVPADLTRPTIASRAPTGTAVPSSASVTVGFSEPVTGVTGSSLTLNDVTTGTAVPATVSCDPPSRGPTLR